MSLSDLTSRQAVLDAIAEYDAVGQQAFLSKYGFGESREYFLEHDGRIYDSKAIVGVAHGYQFPEAGPLRSEDFSGGYGTVERILKRLRFSVRVVKQTAQLRDSQEQQMCDAVWPCLLCEVEARISRSRARLVRVSIVSRLSPVC